MIDLSVLLFNPTSVDFMILRFCSAKRQLLENSQTFWFQADVPTKYNNRIFYQWSESKIKMETAAYLSKVCHIF